MNKHTPGPWNFHAVMGDLTPHVARQEDRHEFATARAFISSGEKIIGEITYYTNSMSYPYVDDHREFVANAHLTTAAPELLEAFEYAVSKYGQDGGPWNVPSDPGGWLDHARAAIAKAKGE